MLRYDKGRTIRTRSNKRSPLTILLDDEVFTMLQDYSDMARLARGKQFVVNHQLRLAYQMQLLFSVPAEDFTNEFIDAHIKGLYDLENDAANMRANQTELSLLSNDAIQRIKQAITSELPSAEIKRREWLWKNRENRQKKFDQFQAEGGVLKRNE